MAWHDGRCTRRTGHLHSPSHYSSWCSAAPRGGQLQHVHVLTAGIPGKKQRCLLEDGPVVQWVLCKYEGTLYSSFAWTGAPTTKGRNARWDLGHDTTRVLLLCCNVFTIHLPIAAQHTTEMKAVHATTGRWARTGFPAFSPGGCGHRWSRAAWLHHTGSSTRRAKAPTTNPTPPSAILDSIPMVPSILGRASCQTRSPTHTQLLPSTLVLTTYTVQRGNESSARCQHTPPSSGPVLFTYGFGTISAPLASNRPITP